MRIDKLAVNVQYILVTLFLFFVICHKIRSSPQDGNEQGHAKFQYEMFLEVVTSIG